MIVDAYLLFIQLYNALYGLVYYIAAEILAKKKMHITVPSSVQCRYHIYHMFKK